MYDRMGCGSKRIRKWIITFENSFHARTLATMSASGKPQFAELFEPKVPGFPKAKLNDKVHFSLFLTRLVVLLFFPIYQRSIQSNHLISLSMNALKACFSIGLNIDAILGTRSACWDFAFCITAIA
jgi:hypothetical protein